MHLLDLLFPKFCVSCGRIGSYICLSCQKTIIRVSETICPVCERSTIGGKTHQYCTTRYSLDGLISFFRYRGAVQKAIKQVKYRFVSDIATSLISLTRESQLHLIEGTVVPIPLHSSRYRHRGFNQAELFGKELASIYNLPYARDMIRRTKASIPQVEMNNKKERLANMKHMFEVVKRTSVPKRIILVDDVFTTGATMREAGSVLKRNGAAVVWGVTIAR